MKFTFLAILLFLFFPVAGQPPLKLEVIRVDQDLTFWGISAVDDNVAWISASKGTIGRTVDGGKHWAFTPVKGFETREFRSIYAFDARTAIIANVGSPAFVLKTVDGGMSWSTVYQNDSPDAFIDGIDFWNEKEGLVYGDPINGRMLLVRTVDAGQNWIADPAAPALQEGQASFASSGTGIRCFGSKTIIIATGGLVSQMFISKDKGTSWQASSPLLRQGSKTGGIFSSSFRSDTEGIVVGGDFADSLAMELSLYTLDGGSTWTAPTQSPRGTRWCVEFVTGLTAVAVGPSGGDITLDGGRSWAPLFDDRGFHVVRKSRTGRLVIAAGAKGKLALLK